MSVKLYGASVAPLWDEARFARLAADIWPARQTKIARLRADTAKRLSLGGALLLRRALLDAGMWSDALTEGEHGKPCFADLPDFHFSLSHSGVHVLCAVGTRELGCDIEQDHAFDPALSRRFFHPAETQALLDAPEDQRQDLFFRLWTCKESYMKATGLGFALPMSAFAVSLRDGEGTVRLASGADSRRLRSFRWDNCWCALCAEEDWDGQLIGVDFSEA